MVSHDTNRTQSGSENKLRWARDSVPLTRREFVRGLRTHCEECKAKYSSLSESAVRRRENWSPYLLSSNKSDPESIRPDPHYLVHAGNFMGLRTMASLDDLLRWANYMPEVAWNNIGQAGIQVKKVSIQSEPPPSVTDQEKALHWVTDWPYSDEPGEMFPFGISLLLLQSSMLLGGFVTGLDPFGLQRWLPHLTGSVALIGLAFAIIFFNSLAATILFYLLRNRKGGARHVFPRAIWRVFPPLFLAYTPIFVFTSIAVATFNLGVFAVFGAMFTAIVAFRDEEFRLPSWKIRSLITYVRTQVLIAAGAYVAIISIMYLVPDLILGVDESVLLGPWMIDFNSLGYAGEELIERMRLGGLLAQIAMGMCLSGVTAYLLRTVYVLEPDNSR